MKGDFTRKTFHKGKHHSRVLVQQGRVTVDADPNEQTDILLHYLRTLAADVIGPYAAPFMGGGFKLTSTKNELVIGRGRYYVDGILVENEADYAYAAQPDYPVPPDDALLRALQKPDGKTYWGYLDVWERHVTFIEDGAMRDVALGEPDTCTRSKVVWQVKAKEIDSAAPAPPTDPAAVAARCAAPLGTLVPLSAAAMAARVDQGYQSDDPCVLSPTAKYRGTENHLYRVEIHQGSSPGPATFKWSRDNGSAVSRWLGTEGNDLSVASGRAFAGACWVELIDDTKELLGQPGALVKLSKVEGTTLSVDPASIPTTENAHPLQWSELLVNPKARRWDQEQNGDLVLVEGAVPVVESEAPNEQWINLEDGIQVRFAPDGEYRTGDYWLIPARVSTGKIEWPENEEAAAPHGIEHHYAPLGFVSWPNGEPVIDPQCRCVFEPRSNCFFAALASKPKLARPQTRSGAVSPAKSGISSAPGSTGHPPRKPAAKRRRSPG